MQFTQSRCLACNNHPSAFYTPFLLIWSLLSDLILGNHLLPAGYVLSNFLSSFIFWPYCTACRILIPWMGIEHATPAVVVWSLINQITRTVPWCDFLKMHDPSPKSLWPSTLNLVWTDQKHGRSPLNPAAPPCRTHQLVSAFQTPRAAQFSPESASQAFSSVLWITWLPCTFLAYISQGWLLLFTLRRPN